MNKPATHHSNLLFECEKCDEILLTAHPLLVSWFKEEVKPKHRDCHISEAWRNEFDQRMDYASGKSKAAWPHSKHNKMDEQGNPCSLALDLFQLATNKMACFPWNYYKKIADEARDTQFPINWGGDFKALHDGPHFELEEPLPKGKS